MRKCYKGIPGDITNYYSDSFGIDDFFLYVSCKVTIEHALSVIGILTPKFFEIEGRIFWENSQSLDEMTKLEKEKSKKIEDIKKDERYGNIFAIDNFFQKWEETSDASISQVERDKRDIKILLEFAKQIEKYWRLALADCFPEKKFFFEISENGILSEIGVCLTFWQIYTLNESVEKSS